MDELVRQKLSREMTHAQPIQSERPLADWLSGMNTMQKLGLLQIPVVSDAAGLLGDLQQYRDEPESRGLLNYSLTGLGLLPFMPNMTVFHGSPHKWLPEEGFSMGRPRLDRIGTGEGAQAYGHGMYFAESPGVAKSYQFQNVSVDPDAVKYSNRKAATWYNRALAEQDFANRIGDRKSINEANAKAYFWEQIMTRQHPDAVIQRAASDDGWPELANYAQSLKRDKFNVPKAGEMYTLDLPDERLPDLLDWDKPLSQQPEAVRKALTDNYIANWLGDLDAQTGEELISRMYRSAGGDGQVIAKELAEAGIPGLRYLDAGSRGAGNGTSNFVVWDQALLDEMARRMANMANKK